MRRWFTFLSAMCGFLLVASVALAATGVPHGWSKIGKVTGSASVYRMDFCDATHGLAFFEGVGFKTTSNGGKTWKKVSNLPAGFSLRGISMGTSKVGYIVGAKGGASPGGTVYVTTDGGKTWTDRSSQLSAGELYNVYAVGDKHAWAVGYGMLIFATEDGGATWKKQNGDDNGIGRLQGVYFKDASHGWATGITWDSPRCVFYRTSTGGASWESTSMPGQTNLTCLQFLDATHGPATGYANPGQRTTLYTTTNGGFSWRPKTLPKAVGSVHFMGFSSVSKGWIVGGLFPVPFWQTTNSAGKWSPYLVGSAVTTFNMPNRSYAFLFVRNRAQKIQLYRWKK
jgi:photosystem II stability/assembly factor-like uncharacterized protein